MEYRTLEKLGIETSLLGYGCMRFPVDEKGNIDEAKAELLLDTAMAGGVNYIDTAYPYHGGQSEPFVGRVLQKYDRASYFLATKLPVWQVNSIEDADRIFFDQLKRLQTEYVDFYLLHALGKERWRAMVRLGVVDRLLALKAQGKIRYLGFSFHDDYEVFEEICTYRDWDFCQIQLNYMDTEDQAGLKGYELALSRGIPVVVMEPIKGGTLASFAEDIMEKFHASRPGASASSFAMRFVGSFPGVKVILSGMTTMDHVTDNLKTFTNFEPLSAAEQETIRDVVNILRSRVQNGCTGCRYCMPCPLGVDIPGSFGVWNTYHMYQNYNTVRWKWETDLGDKKQPKNCVECGKCEKACPQHLEIRRDLKRVQADLDKKEMMR